MTTIFLFYSSLFATPFAYCSFMKLVFTGLQGEKAGAKGWFIHSVCIEMDTFIQWLSV